MGDAHLQHRTELFGLPVDALTLDETASRARELARHSRRHQHVALNAAKVVAAQADADLRRIVTRCSLVSADGASVVWAARALGRPLPERVAGIDLMLRLLGHADRDGSRVFLLGATPDVVARVADTVARRYPHAQLVGVRDGYWSDDDAVVRAVNEARPDYLFLGIPTPAKEFWLDRWLPSMEVGLAMGVGGSFDVVAGVRSRAPDWLQRTGLEWSWRLAQEPRRMWRRYLVGNARFALLLARTWLRERR